MSCPDRTWTGWSSPARVPLVFRPFLGFVACFLRERMDLFSEKSLGSNHRDGSPILGRIAGRFTGFSIIVHCRGERKR